MPAPSSATTNPTATTKTLWSTLFRTDLNILCGDADRYSIRQRPSDPIFRPILVILYKYSAHWRRAKRSRITHAHRNLQQSARRCLGRENLRIGGLRQVSSVAPNRGEGLLTERKAGAQPERREPLFMPHSCPCPQAGRSVVQILPSEASARRSKKGPRLVVLRLLRLWPLLLLTPIGEHEPRIDDKDVQRIDGEGCNGCCQARDQDPPAARRWSEIRPCRVLRAARRHRTLRR